MDFRNLWCAPSVNPITKKAFSVPVLNPVDKYGRTFYFSTFGFMIAFLSWYAFPPLMTKTIKKDLHLSQAEIANSNIIALVATLIVRVIVGPLCDRFGPRLVFAGVLLAGSLPTALAGTVTSATGLIVLRFFVGILGATFVPCQVWSTGFYDKTVVGTANSLMAGIGNSGGGITYFVMPAVFQSLVSDQGLSDHVAWRVAFVVPFILIVAAALGMIFLCEDTPTGPWAERHLHVLENTIVQHAHGVSTADKPTDNLSSVPASSSKKSLDKDVESNHDVAEGEIIVQNEVVQKPSFEEAIRVIFSLPTLLLAGSYATTFGAELSVNSILGSYYAKNFPHMGQSKSGAWAAMFGLLNIVFRPIGGIVSDYLYRATGSVMAKKFWLIFLNVIMGCFCLAIGLTDSHNQSTLIGLFAGMAFFMEAGNGANFALVPHAHPFANGIISGVVGASGNLGGIIYAIIFRYNGIDYGKAIWIIGAITIGVNVFISWINPVPR